MNGSIDLTLEDEPTHVYEEYEGYPTTNSETLSSILPLPNNSSTTTSQKNHYKRGRPRESFIWQHFNDDGNVRTCQVQVKASSQNPSGICGKKFPNTSGTTNCINHLLKCHDILTPDKKTMLKMNDQIDIRDMMSKKKTLSIKEQEKINSSLLKFIIENSQPFHILESVSFQDFLSTLNPNYQLPTQQKIDELLEYSYQNAVNKLKKIISTDTEFISLTSDFWTSRGKHGYIGITCCWLDSNFEPHEALLLLQYVPFPHTAEVIHGIFKETILDWKLENKVACITTDNGSNIIKATRILQNDLNINRLSCSAHTLNLVVTNALKSNLLIQTFILRVKRVINFFSTPKQAENLHNEQINLNYTKVYRVIKDVSTRWNSSFYSWQRLILLKDAIKHLPGRLKADQNRENKKDGKRLERIMLSDDEWQLMNELTLILRGFEELTRMMSGNSYVTLSLIYPSITTLKNNLDELLSKERSIDELLIEELEGNENTVIEEQDDVFDIVDIPDEDVADDIVVSVSGNKKKLNISRPIDTSGIKIFVVRKLLENLKKYWSVPSSIATLSTILDPRLKSLRFFDSERIEQIKSQLKEECLIIKDRLDKSELNESQNNFIINNIENEMDHSEHDLNNVSILKQILQPDNDVVGNYNEISHYLSSNVRNDIDPFKWWNGNKNNFPILTKLAKKFLCISATSVASERLFSDVGNIITAKRTNLKPERVGKMVFLKRNLKIVQPFS